MIDIHELSKLSTLDMQKAVLDDLSSLSIVCVTNNKHNKVYDFIQEMHILAEYLGAELLDQAIMACSGEWVLRLDDDEKVSESLAGWLWQKGYMKTGADLYAFPRIYLYPDAYSFLVNPGMYPDLQTRLGRKDKMFGVNSVHAGNPNGTGVVVPYALEHHKLLVRDFRERQLISERYEDCRPGAGTRPEYARYNLPELFYDELKTKPYTNLGNFAEVKK
jgi:hypothetical protein